MHLVSFYQRLLCPQAPWRVSAVDLSADAGRVDVWLDHPGKTLFPCPKCARPCPVRDHVAERIWRHLDTCESTTWLHARLPRISCPEHGIVQVRAPMSDGSSRFSAAMERRCIDTLLECSREGVSRLTGLSWDEADGLMRRSVARGLRKRSDALPQRLGIDEKSVFKRHKYCTVIADLASGTVFDVLDSRTIDGIEPWFQDRAEAMSQVEQVAMDMSAGFANVVSRLAAKAEICYDHFHVTQLLTRSVDTVRKAEQKLIEDPEQRKWFFRSRFLPLYNEENIPEHRIEQFERVKKISDKTARAWALKESFREIWTSPTAECATGLFKKWFWWATHSRLEPVRKAAHTIKRHWQGILNAIVRGVTNACTEGLNNKIERIKRDACGFRSKASLRAAVMFHCGGLDLYPATD